MDVKKEFFYSLTIKSDLPVGVSSQNLDEVHYFSTRRKLESWQKKNPESKGILNQHEISILVAKQLIKQSKKKKREACGECGK